MNWASIAWIVGVLASLGGIAYLAYRYGENRANKRHAERQAEIGREAKKIDEEVGRMSDAAIDSEFRKQLPDHD